MIVTSRMNEAAKQQRVANLAARSGGTIGTLIPVLVAAGAFLAFPVLGLVVAGPIAASLAGAGAAGLAVGLIGALSDWGIREERVKQYQAGINAGGILMGVKPRSDKDAAYIEKQWKASGGQHVHS